MTRAKDIVHEFEAKLARLRGDERRSQEGIDLINWVGWMLVPVDIKRACVLFAGRRARPGRPLRAHSRAGAGRDRARCTVCH